ncbi:MULTISPECIES: PRC-barrel domain-containing protein [unclassified Aureimonas]|uniref:PRC-barrel domain-containing protein n=1 Tax=unclassified Aureimonas TaxID=2615206 RepID=UPI0006F689E1|nr:MULTISPECIES: PRC-barrel domain-containing protein [unclassified Aureimonas]KQT57423.1 hypothetical protein ASG62_08855 [Aureimonas sp. Leaf427]KQT77102.1 hypothetical protein ASG54_12720 [Aureimonas sp. Leaf460]
MFDRKTIASVVIATSLFGAATAHAQTTALVEVADATMIPMINSNADALEDLAIHNAAGVKIGEIEEVLGTDAATATAVAVDFDDKAGFGNEDRIVPLESLTLNGVKLILSADAAAVGALPIYND